MSSAISNLRAFTFWRREEREEEEEREGRGAKTGAKAPKATRERRNRKILALLLRFVAMAGNLASELIDGPPPLLFFSPALMSPTDSGDFADQALWSIKTPHFNRME